MAQRRCLTEEEIAWVRRVMDGAPPGRKPSIRWFAKRLGVNRPSVIKSLGGWDNIQRNRPEPPPKPKTIDLEAKPVIEPYTTDVKI